MAVWIEIITDDIMDNTWLSILLNSSKQTHEPLADSPLKNLTILAYSKLEEQLSTMHNFASYLPKSLVVSVLPVPTGPSGAPP